MYEGRAQSPFDASAIERLRRMGLTDENGKPDRDAIVICSYLFAGQFFDDLVYKPPGSDCQVEAFIESLEPKLREKLVMQIFRLPRTSTAGLKEPHYKHFSIEKYRDLCELREKNRVVIRIIFTVGPDGEVLLLHAFQKRQSRDTMQALERSLKLLSLLREHPEHAVEYKVKEELK